jgi:hypothetical protein
LAIKEPLECFDPIFKPNLVQFRRGKYAGERDIFLLTCRLTKQEDRRVYLWTPSIAARDRPDPWVVEVIADVKLRDAYGLRDCEIIDVEIDL